MLDIGFSEILLTSAIALVVLGPERLPKVARQIGNFLGRARAMARQLSEQLDREVSAEELMRQRTRAGAPGAPTAAAAPGTATTGPATEATAAATPEATSPTGTSATGTSPAATPASVDTTHTILPPNAKRSDD